MLKLYPYQTKGVKLGLTYLEKYKSCLLADEMGLGKTPQGLRMLHALARPGSLNIIIVPGFLKPKWADEIVRFLPKKRNYTIILKNYSEISNGPTLRYLTQYKYDVLITDEGHYAKSFESLRTMATFGSPGQTAIPIVKRCRYKLNLSGTPIPNRVGEIYPWLWATKHKLIRDTTYSDWVHKWASYAKDSKHGLRHSGIVNADKFKKILYLNTVRRTVKQVLPDLKDPVKTVIPVEITAELYETEKELQRELLEMSGQKQVDFIVDNPEMFEAVLKTMPNFAKMTTYKKQAGLLKYKAVTDYFKSQKEEIQGLKKIVIFTYHNELAEKYVEFFQGWKAFKNNVVLINGQGSPEQRNALVNAANKKKYCVMVCTMKSVAAGLDFTDFSYAFYTENDWSPNTLDQSGGRFTGLRALGRAGTFFYYFLFNKGIEASIFKTVAGKRKTIDLIFGT